MKIEYKSAAVRDIAQKKEYIEAILKTRKEVHFERETVSKLR